MQTEGINVGKAIKKLRKDRNVTKDQLAEQIGISISHLEKIESGARRPGIDTYQRLLSILGADMVIHKEIETVQEECAEKVQKILLGSTESQAVFMTNMVEAMAHSIKMVT